MVMDLILENIHSSTVTCNLVDCDFQMKPTLTALSRAPSTRDRSTEAAAASAAAASAARVNSTPLQPTLNSSSPPEALTSDPTGKYPALYYVGDKMNCTVGFVS